MKRFLFLFAACTLIHPELAEAKSPTKDQEIARLTKELSEQKEIINTQQEKISRLETQMDSFLDNIRAMGLPDRNNAGVKRAEKTDHVKEAILESEIPKEVGTERKPVEKETAPDIPALSDEGGVLTKAGKLVIEPQLEYSRSSSLAVAIEGFTIIPALNIGSFQITKADRDTISTAIGARLGITNKLELEARVPFLYRSDTILTRPIGVGTGVETLTDINGAGIGDIEVAAHYQLMQAKDWWPFIIGNLRIKSDTGQSPFDIAINTSTGLQESLPTGSGFYSIQPSFTFIKPSDPVVFFGNLGYTYNATASSNNSAVGEIDPGDAINFGMGMGFSVNEKASFSLGYSHDMVLPTTQNGSTIPNSSTLQIGSMNLGYAYKATDTKNINVNIGAGLTDDAPDVRLTFRVPMSMDVF